MPTRVSPRPEFAALLAQAGLMLTAVTPIAGSFFPVVEALAG
jgi:hypothetical protein